MGYVLDSNEYVYLYESRTGHCGCTVTELTGLGLKTSLKSPFFLVENLEYAAHSGIPVFISPASSICGKIRFANFLSFGAYHGCFRR